MSAHALPAAIAPAPATVGHDVTEADIDNSYIASRGDKKAKNPANFLDDGVRDVLYAAVEGSASRFGAYVLAAIGELRMDQLVKEPEELNMFLDFVVDGATGYLGKVATKAVAALRSKPAEALIEIGVTAIGVESTDKVKHADSGTVDHAIKGVTGALKKGTTGVMKHVANEDFEADKEETLDYLDALKDSSAKAIQMIPRQTFGRLNDANRILLYRTLEDATPTGVKTAIQASMARYRASPVSKIGRTSAERHLDKNALKGGSPAEIASNVDTELKKKKVHKMDDLRDTRLYLHRFTNHDGDVAPRLYYYKRDYASGVRSHLGNAAFGDTTSKDAQDALDLDARDEDFVLYKEVEPEFVDMAMQRNRRAWGEDYGTKTFSDDIHSMTKRPAPVKDLATQAAVASLGGAANNHPAVDSPVMRTD